MAEQRKYSLDEIDLMRSLVAGLFTAYHMPGWLYHVPSDEDRRVEERLRTYMMNGTSPEELEAQLENIRAQTQKRYEESLLVRT
jgi:hypothetical protein